MESTTAQDIGTVPVYRNKIIKEHQDTRERSFSGRRRQLFYAHANPLEQQS